jgi:hypothetical protein
MYDIFYTLCTNLFHRRAQSFAHLLKSKVVIPRTRVSMFEQDVIVLGIDGQMDNFRLFLCKQTDKRQLPFAR